MATEYDQTGPFVNEGNPPIDADFLNRVEAAILSLALDTNTIFGQILTIVNKLNTVQDGATANETDEYLLDLGNHTGMLAQNLVNGLEDALAVRPVAVPGTRVPLVFLYSDVNVARPTPSAAYSIWWFATDPLLDVPVNALDYDRVDLLGA